MFDNNKKLCKSLGIKVLPYLEIIAGSKGKVESFSCGPSKISQLQARPWPTRTCRCEPCACRLSCAGAALRVTGAVCPSARRRSWRRTGVISARRSRAPTSARFSKNPKTGVRAASHWVGCSA